MGNRILAAASGWSWAPEERGLPPTNATRWIFGATPSRRCEHDWPGNLRELETVLERALLLYREGNTLDGKAVRAAR